MELVGRCSSRFICLANNTNQLLNRHPPFGNNIVAAAKSFPKFTIGVDEQYLLLHQGAKPVQAVLKLSIGVANAGKNMRVVGGILNSMLISHIPRKLDQIALCMHRSLCGIRMTIWSNSSVYR